MQWRVIYAPTLFNLAASQCYRRTRASLLLLMPSFIKPDSTRVQHVLYNTTSIQALLGARYCL